VKDILIECKEHISSVKYHDEIPLTKKTLEKTEGEIENGKAK